jgi:hypothetical protein
VDGCTIAKAYGSPEALPAVAHGGGIAAHLLRPKKKGELPAPNGFFLAAPSPITAWKVVVKRAFSTQRDKGLMENG